MKTYDDAVTSFREGMAHLCTPVSVITAFDGDRPHGTTVSAIMSLSMHPPMVAVALDRNSQLLDVIQRSHRFGVNILAGGQSDLGVTFARKGDDKFADVDWNLEDQLPRLAGATGWLACYVAQVDEGGDHLLLQGAVLNTATEVSSPLTYFARSFGTHKPCAS
ncbi:flavin reductase family protein [Nocardioides sp. NPDC059952]|uniref:flavin reductase family protein n=1 Tax=Nocardioides sp. NPDC059952 TaxID=3347014 RepID=UPI00364740BC